MAEPKKRILVVDDSVELQEFFRLVLEDAGYEATAAMSGEDALTQMKAQRPDLILLDLVMPGMDGFEFLARLRSDFAPPIPPSILCSGFDLTEQEALRRGALMFVRKPLGPADLLEFVAQGLLGERVSAETAARERANSAAARSHARQAAAAFASLIRTDVEHRATGQMAWLAAYFGLETAVIALMENDRLTVVAAAGDPAFKTGLNLADKLTPSNEILESGSSLVLADASTHACFSSGPYRVDDARFFAGVPLMAGDIPVGVLCVLDRRPRRTSAEDLLILEEVGRQGSLALRLADLGRPKSQMPGRLGPGMLLRGSLEVLIDAELRLLRQTGGSMELAVVEMDDPQQMRDAVISAGNRERLAAGELGPGRVGVYKRDPGRGASGQMRTLLKGLEGTTHLRGVGAAAIGGGAHMPAIGSQDLVHLAELELELALETAGSTQRLVLQHEAG